MKDEHLILVEVFSEFKDFGKEKYDFYSNVIGYYWEFQNMLLLKKSYHLELLVRPTRGFSNVDLDKALEQLESYEAPTKAEAIRISVTMADQWYKLKDAVFEDLKDQMGKIPEEPDQPPF